MTIKTALKFLFASGLVLAPVSLMAERFSTLEERMTQAEFAESGLHKLSAEELARLNEWIRLRSLAEGEAFSSRPGSVVDSDGVSRPPADFEGPFNTHIVGRFNGWEGPIELEMGDGTVWRVTENRSFHTRTMDNPRVEIKQAMFGGWNLSVEGYNRRFKVRRIK